ncbi:ATP-binding protein [soil metagenome]
MDGVTRQRLRIAADLTQVAEVRALVRSAVDAIDPLADAACQDDLVQAVDEAATNTILHGYRGAPGWLEVAIERVGDELVLTVEDDAPLFDPTRVPGPDLTVEPEVRTPGGMGIHLIRAGTDDVRHSPRPGGGNILTMTRRLDRRPKEER